MRHLIVEACIARNLLDTSAYLWPGYVNGRSNQLPRSVPDPMPGWSSLMKGSPLTPPMINVLVSTPASRYAGSPISLFIYCLCVGVVVVLEREGGGGTAFGSSRFCLLILPFSLKCLNQLYKMMKSWAVFDFI